MGSIAGRDGREMARKKPEQEISVTVTLPRGLWAEVLAWGDEFSLPTEAMVAQALRRYLKEERHKAFLATNPIYE